MPLASARAAALGGSSSPLESALLVAVGNDGKIATSPDGATWTQQTTPHSGHYVDVCFSPELQLFVAVGAAGQLATSTNGVNWAARTSGFGSEGIRSVAWGAEAEMFLAVGTNGTSGTSSDGINWTTDVNFSADYDAWRVAWSPALELFCVTLNPAAGKSVIGRTSDGESFTLATSLSVLDDSDTVHGVAWSPHRELFCVGTGTSEARFLTSPDAATWTGRGPSVPSVPIYDLAWSEDLTLFVATGFFGSLATSPSGTTWTSRTSNLDGDLRAAHWSDDLDLFVVGGSGGDLATSTNGTSWTARTSSFSTTQINAITSGAPA